MFTRVKVGLAAAMFVAFMATDTQACHRYSGGGYCQPSCCYPCYPLCCPCWPPDTRPLDPLPKHPEPHGPTPATLTLYSPLYLEVFAEIWIRHRDCVYRIYRNQIIPPPTLDVTLTDFFQGDHLLVYTWSRRGPNDFWQCRCCHLIVLRDEKNTFDVINCHYSTGAYKKAAANGPSPATILVNLPAEATLTFDDRATKSTSATRVFTTPDLAPGETYSYSLKAELKRNGAAQIITRNVTVRGGQETMVNLDFASTAIAAK